MKRIIFQTFLKNTVLGALLLSNLVLVTLLVLSSKAMVSLTLQESQLQEKIAALRKAKITVRDFSDEKIRQEEKSLKKIFVDQSVPLEAIKEIVDIAKKIGIQRINIAQEYQFIKSEFPGVKIIPVKIRFNSSYQNMLIFLKDISDSHILMDVRNLEVVRNASKLPDLEFNLTVNTFVVLTKDKPSPQASSDPMAPSGIPPENPLL